MDRETQFLQTVLDFRTAHKQTPQKARTVILDQDRKSTRLNSSHSGESRMPSSA